MLDIRIGKKFPNTQDRRKISYSRTPSKGKFSSGMHIFSNKRTLITLLYIFTTINYFCIDMFVESYRGHTESQDRDTRITSRDRLKSSRSDKRLATPKVLMSDKMSMDMGSNLSLKYKKL